MAALSRADTRSEADILNSRGSLWAPTAMLYTCHQYTGFFGFFCPGTNKGGCALLVLPFNGTWNPPYPQNIIQAQLPSTLSPGSYHWNLLISLDPILDLMLPDTQFSASHPVLSKSHRASPVAAALSLTEEHFLRQAGEQVRFPNGYGMEI